MNAQQLKNAILQEAIEGRLVPQDPNDEPASILLERIRAEKARLVKEGKLKKKDLEVKPISEDEIPFEIPDSWEWCRLGDVTEIARGGSPRPIKEYLTDDTNGLNWIKIGDTDKGGKYINSCKEKIKPEGLKKTRMVHPGDFLLTNSMSFGRPYITNIEGCIHDGWLMISPYAGVFDQSFLFYVLSSAFAHKQFSGKVAGAVVQNLNSDKVADSFVPLPPLAEQKRIVEKIEELLPKVEKYGKAQDELNKLNEELPERLKKSILQEAIEGRLVPQDPNDEPASVLLQKIREEKQQLVKAGKLKKDKNESYIYRTEDGHWLEHYEDKKREDVCIDEDIPFDIPESWEWCRLYSIATNSLGKTLNGGNTVGLLKPYLCTINVYWNKIDLSKVKTTAFSEKDCEKYILKCGDLLICEGGDFGRSAIWNQDKEMYYQNALHRVSFFGGLNPYLYMYYLELCKSSKILDEFAKGMTIKHLTQDALYSMVFPLPPLAEQKRIVAKIEQLLGEIDKLKK